MIFYEKDTKHKISYLYSKLPLNVLEKISDFGLNVTCLVQTLQKKVRYKNRRGL